MNSTPSSSSTSSSSTSSQSPIHPADLAPLSYGPGLALGLMLILGLPAEKPPVAPVNEITPTTGERDFERQAVNGRKTVREQWSRLSASRP